MNDTRTGVDADTFATLVESHRVSTEKLETTYWHYAEHTYRYRRDATSVQKFVWHYSVGGIAGFTLGLIVAVLLFASMPADWMPAPLVAGALAWGGMCFLAYRVTRTAFVPLTKLAVSVEARLQSAASEFRTAVTDGREGGQEALDAFESMQPGLEELFLEHWSLEQARDTASRFPHQRDYHDSLDAELARVSGTLADVLAEVQAAAAVLHSQRPDLLVAPVIEATEPVARISRLSEDGQSSLAQARTNLARVIAG